MATLLASPDELTAIGNIDQAKAWAGLSDGAWNGLQEQLGQVTSLRVLAALPPHTVQAEAQGATKVITPAIAAVEATDEAPEMAAVPEDRDQLSPVDLAQVGLLYRVARQKAGLPDVDPFTLASIGAPGTWNVAPGTPSGSPHGPPPAVSMNPYLIGGASKDFRKIKMSQILDQTDESEIPPLTNDDQRAFWRLLRQRKGGEVRADQEPTDDQIAALKVRVVDLNMSPYADFALFTNFGLRFLKGLKFTNHVMQPDGSWRTVEVPGPPNYDAWYTSWRVFENVLLGLTVKVPDPNGAGNIEKPIISQASLDSYREAFRDLCKAYPEVWHLCYTAEDRCRCEHFPRLRRKLEDDFITGILPRFCMQIPWDSVMRFAAADRGYWDEFVREPALKFLATGNKRKGTPTGSMTGEIPMDNGAALPDYSGVGKKRKNKQKSRGQPPPPSRHPQPRPQGRGKGNGGKGKPSVDADGLMSRTREDKKICFAWNNGGCEQMCPNGFAHVCQICLGSHRKKDHQSRGGKGGRK